MSLTDTAFQQRIAQLGQQGSTRLKDSKVYQLPYWNSASSCVAVR